MRCAPAASPRQTQRRSRLRRPKTVASASHCRSTLLRLLRAHRLGNSAGQAQRFVGTTKPHRRIGEQQHHALVLRQQPAEALVFPIRRVEKAVRAIQIPEPAPTPRIERRKLDDLRQGPRPFRTFAVAPPLRRIASENSACLAGGASPFVALASSINASSRSFSDSESGASAKKRRTTTSCSSTVLVFFSSCASSV